MLRGYRCAVIAAFGWLILAAGPAPNSNDQAEKPKPAQTVERSLESVATAQDKIAKASEAGEYEAPCGDGQYNNKSDLCAQWYAARAARDAADWAWWALAVGIVGAFGIVAALALTVDSNRIARDTARRQLRAYVGVEACGINEWEFGKCRVPLDLKNRGQTPAHNLMVFSKFAVAADPAAFDPAEHSGYGIAGERSDQTMGPTENRFILCYLRQEFAEPHMAKIFAKEMAIIHFGYVVYTDVFDQVHETRFAFYHWGDELSDTTSLRCRFGNYSN